MSDPRAIENALLERNVSATRHGLWGLYGAARLTIAPGHIVLHPRFSLALVSGLSRLDHTDTDVHVVTFRIGIPWLRSFLILHGSTGGSAAVSLTPWLRGELRDALTKAGFRVFDTKGWLQHGDVERLGQTPTG